MQPEVKLIHRACQEYKVPTYLLMIQKVAAVDATDIQQNQKRMRVRLITSS